MQHKATISLSLAFAGLVLLSPSFTHAMSHANMQPARAETASALAHQEAMRMVPARANLLDSIDARKIRPGYQFEAELRDTVHLKNGPELPRGTRLIGTVTADHMQPDGPSRLALRFTGARLKNGTIVPIKAAIVHFTGPGNGIPGVYSDDALNFWDNSMLQIDVVNALSGVDLHTRIAGGNSGVFVSKKKKDVKLDSGSRLALALAAAPSHAMKSGA